MVKKRKLNCLYLFYFLKFVMIHKGITYIRVKCKTVAELLPFLQFSDRTFKFAIHCIYVSKKWLRATFLRKELIFFLKNK